LATGVYRYPTFKLRGYFVIIVPMDLKKIIGEKTSLNLQKIIDRRIEARNRSPWGAKNTGLRLGLALAVALLFVTTLPFVTTGNPAGIKEVLVKLGILEKKIHRVRSLSEYRLPSKFFLCGKPMPLNRPDVREAFEREFYINLGRRTGPIIWIKRASKFFPHIERRLKARGLPDDLKYLAVAESDLNVYAASPSKAVGLWQFIPGTAREHALRVDAYLDERRDLVRSTEAAADFLESLYKRFGDWHLAMAAYNCGPGRVSRELKKQNVTSYYDLNLPIETERYIYRIASIKLIMANRKNYGLDIPAGELYPELKFDTVTINVPVRDLYFGIVAEPMGMTFKQLRELNPSLEGDHIPKGTVAVNVPPGRGGEFLEKWGQLKKSKKLKSSKVRQRGAKRRIHVVRKGETLNSIARRYGVTVTQVCRWNKINRKSLLHTGKKLVIYR